MSRPAEGHTETYRLRDFKLHIDSQDSPRHNYDNRGKREAQPRTNLSQSEHDWAFAKRGLARGDEPEDVIQKIARHRSTDKANPEYYARHTVEKAQADLNHKSSQKTAAALQTTKGTDLGLDCNERP
jgi:hypothetical protein